MKTSKRKSNLGNLWNNQYSQDSFMAYFFFFKENWLLKFCQVKIKKKKKLFKESFMQAHGKI